MSSLRGLAFGFVLLAAVAVPARGQQLDTTLFRALRARSIGPAGMSGRVTAFDVVLERPEVIYAGTASGGLWKSESGGIAWAPVFDHQPVASIGAVAVFQKNPDLVWAGTGEGNPRNSQTSGDGLFKSRDGGRTWQRAGLEGTRNIHRILLHPDDPDVVYVGVQGSAWGDHPERGVFKTTDGGATWQKVLYADAGTGVADLVMDPGNPDKLIAAMWSFRRQPWFFRSGGAGSGLYVTVDGGRTWQRRTEDDGLPGGELGRIGLAIARSDPRVVYALVEAKKNALYRSDDGGRAWRKVAEENIGSRPFYYAEIAVDPKNENRVYNVHSEVDVSEDGGKTFRTLVPFASVHPDHHAWWIHPDDPDFILDGNDGGMAISHDRGRSWRFVETLPLAQFYHINVDRQTPYHVYGGMQDNGSWRGPAYAWRAGGLRNSYWEEVAFGDGFDVVPDSSSDRHLYAMSQGGYLYRTDLVTGEQKSIRPVHPQGVPLRFNWNAGLAHDPFDRTTIYYGSQFVHQSTDRGESWTIISPDLTTNDPEKQQQLESGGLTYDVTAAENHTTIVAIAPSPVARGVLWVGTDDGNVQLTRDGGQTWANVGANVRGVPSGSWVPQVHASAYDAAEAFVVFDNHRRNDWAPYVFRTKDYGRTWTRVVDEQDVWGYALSVVQDPVEPRLLFVGTEFGLDVSVDGGAQWTKWVHGYPTVSTMDLAIQPVEHDLVAGTFGRGAYVLDDLRPLRALARQGLGLLAKPVHAFDAPDAYLSVVAQAPGTRFAGHAIFAGENRPYGARLTYSVKVDTAAARPAPADSVAADSTADSTAAPKDHVRIEVVDGAGRVIRTLRGPAKNGLNRVTWDLDRRGVRFPTQPRPGPDAPEPGGPAALPGTYTVRFRYGTAVDSATVRVRLDPRLDVARADLEAGAALVDRLMRRLDVATAAMDRLRAAQQTIRRVDEQLQERDDAAAKAVKQRGRAMQDSIKVLTERFAGREVQGIRDDPATVNARLGQAFYAAQSAFGAPGPSQRLLAEQAEAALQEAVVKVNTFFERDWAAYRQAVESAQPQLFGPYEPLRVE